MTFPHLTLNAYGGLKAQFKFSNDRKILHVVGTLVGTIKKVFKTRTADGSADEVREQENLNTSVEPLHLTPPGDQQQYISGGSWAEAWIRLCKIMDQAMYSGIAIKRTLHLPENGFENALRSLDLHSDGEPEPVTNDAGTYQYGSPEPPTWDGINVILKPQRLRNAKGELIIEERFYFISLDSGYVGFGGHAIREGDAVCILKGGSYPFVLRARRDGLYHLISDSCAFYTTIRKYFTILTMVSRYTRVINGKFVDHDTVADRKWEEFGVA